MKCERHGASRRCLGVDIGMAHRRPMATVFLRPVAPFQGSDLPEGRPIPRALPWADMSLPRWGGVGNQCATSKFALRVRARKTINYRIPNRVRAAECRVQEEELSTLLTFAASHCPRRSSKQTHSGTCIDATISARLKSRLQLQRGRSWGPSPRAQSRPRRHTRCRRSRENWGALRTRGWWPILSGRHWHSQWHPIYPVLDFFPTRVIFLSRFARKDS
jgi:hypothetical protein